MSRAGGKSKQLQLSETFIKKGMELVRADWVPCGAAAVAAAQAAAAGGLREVSGPAAASQPPPPPGTPPPPVAALTDGNAPRGRVLAG